MHHSLSLLPALSLVFFLGVSATVGVGQVNCDSFDFDPNLGTPQQANPSRLTTGLLLGFSFPFPGDIGVTEISVDPNGRIVFPGTSQADSTPTVAEFLSGSSVICPFWEPLNLGSTPVSDIYFRTEFGRAIVTWCDVTLIGRNQPFTFQVQLSADGSMVFVYDSRANVGSPLVGVADQTRLEEFPLDIRSTPYTNGQGGSIYEDMMQSDLASFVMRFTPNAVGGYEVTSPCANAFTNSPEGCPTNFDPGTTFEFFDGVTSQSDLVGRVFSYTPNGIGGYLVSECTADCVELGYGVQPGSVALTLGDDDLSVPQQLPFPFLLPGGEATTSSVLVESNGVVHLQPYNRVRAVPSPEAFVSAVPAIAMCWGDLTPNFSEGQVWVDVMQNPTRWVLTFDRIKIFNRSDSVTAQLQLFADGSFLHAALDVDTQNERFLIGVTGAEGLAVNALDFSNDLPFDTGADVEPPVISATPPRLGGQTTITISSLPFDTQLVFFLVGARIDIPLVGLGLDGCFRRADGAFGTFGFAPDTTQITIPIPFDASLVGSTAGAQGAALSPASNPLGLAFTRGLQLGLGY